MLRLIRRPKAFCRRSSSIIAVINDQRAALGQGFVGLADQLFLLIQIPVVDDVAHDIDVHRRQRVGEEIAALK
jgi:hypothetical protein